MLMTCSILAAELGMILDLEQISLVPNVEVVFRLFSISTLILTLTLCSLLWSMRLGSRSRSILKIFICICSIEANIGLRSRSRSILKIADRLPHNLGCCAWQFKFSNAINSCWLTLKQLKLCIIFCCQLWYVCVSNSGSTLIIGNWMSCGLSQKKLGQRYFFFANCFAEDERSNGGSGEKNDTILPNAEITFHLQHPAAKAEAEESIFCDC